jgi:NADH-quinone oxidoreductase subunit A
MDHSFFHHQAYLAAGVLIVIALVIATAVLTLNRIFGQKPKETTAKKGDVYECGVTYEGDAHQQFSVRYYLIGIVFLIFDVEVVFMYPWTLVYQSYLKTGAFILIEMALFILLLLGGYIYLRKRKAFSWD